MSVVCAAPSCGNRRWSWSIAPGAELLIVETSGLVEPQALLTQYELLPTKLAARIELRGLLCVVDALHVKESLLRRPEVRQQIERADRLLLSKLDLVSAEELLLTHRLLDELGAATDRVGLSLHSTDSEVAEVLRWALGPRGEHWPRQRSASEVRHGARHCKRCRCDFLGRCWSRRCDSFSTSYPGKCCGPRAWCGCMKASKSPSG